MPRPSWAPDALSLFLELAALPSPPGEERAVADRVVDYLRALGLEADEDDAGGRIGSTIGNILCRLEPRNDGAGAPLFFCAHLDTVLPEAAIEPVVGEDGFVRNAAGTILGADDKSAVAAMLEATARLVEEERAHAGVELLFTPKEEVGLVGAAAFDQSRLDARLGYVYDHAGPIGEVILGAPFQNRIDVRFHGRAAHAGMYPEEGRSAIAAAARAIADLRLGRLDDETSANVGEVRGGTARNIVPEHCWFAAEARSHDERKLADVIQEMVDTITFAAGLGECEVEIQIGDQSPGYRFRRDDLPVQLATTALTRAGREPSFILSGGGADANVFNDRGLQCVNLANGMTDIHTPDERIAVADLDEMVEVTLALVESAREVEDAA
ncbi:MAG TPA: M20/M25/M40 family metallo-hydrolase [Gaiellaceae bacterium]|jgi:tripeptide aminopeptidase|nr:M20/M25/M40 family metallo-hydrolase [Gaiellaceae bacterium]